jgi:hypothetical protein
MYVTRTRNGFVPASRRQVFSKLKHLVTPACPFVNLPETRRSRFGEELNVEKMKKAVWLILGLFWVRSGSVNCSLESRSYRWRLWLGLEPGCSSDMIR